MAMTEQEKFDVVKAVVEGKEWQSLAGKSWVNGDGFDELLVTIVSGWRVRIKPHIKPDEVFYYYAEDKHLVKSSADYEHQLRVTFDGETGKIKSAEVVNQ